MERRARDISRALGFKTLDEMRNAECKGDAIPIRSIRRKLKRWLSQILHSAIHVPSLRIAEYEGKLATSVRLTIRNPHFLPRNPHFLARNLHSIPTATGTCVAG
jgi:hypothetical protein